MHNRTTISFSTLFLFCLSFIGFTAFGCKELSVAIEVERQQFEHDCRPQRVATVDGVTVWKMRKRENREWIYFTTGSNGRAQVLFPDFAEQP